MFWQAWLLDRCTGIHRPVVTHAAEGWPTVGAAEWEEIRAGFLAGARRAVELPATGPIDPPLEFPPMAGYRVEDVMVHRRSTTPTTWARSCSSGRHWDSGRLLAAATLGSKSRGARATLSASRRCCGTLTDVVVTCRRGRGWLHEARRLVFRGASRERD